LIDALGEAERREGCIPICGYCAEDVLALWEDRIDLFIRTAGVARATTKIGMANVAYKKRAQNMKRPPFLRRRAEAPGRCKAKAGLPTAKAKRKTSRPPC
jgi:hypothetical protein